MPIAAMILGVVGGVFGLVVVSGGDEGLTEFLRWNGLRAVAIAIAFASIMGGGLMKAKPSVGASLMAASVVGTLLMNAFYAIAFNVITIMPTALSAIGTLLGFMALLSSSSHRARQ